MSTSPIRREFMDVLLENIELDVHQPRSDFPDVPQEELTANIAEHGQIEPLILYKNGNKFVPIGGTRRIMAGRKLGLKTMFAVVLDCKPEPSEVYLQQLVANSHRLDLNPMELCLSYQLLMETMKINATELAKTVSKSKTYISNILSLSSLPAPIQRLVREGKIGLAKAVLLARMNLDDQSDTVDAILNKELNRQDLEQMTQVGKTSGAMRRITIEMPSATVNLVSKAKISVDDMIDVLQSIIKECKKARTQGLDVATISSICRDRSRAQAVVAAS